uniref:Uncharacterized protein n=1 Tax=Panagrolaimus sp. PS1159 TaxID=55785 RepID=A0AC35EZ05_9BILA
MLNKKGAATMNLLQSSSNVNDNCNPKVDFQQIYDGKNCTNLLFLHEMNHVKYYLEIIDKTNVKQWWITTNNAKNQNFTFQNEIIDEITDYRFFNSNVEIVFQNSNGCYLALWNLIFLDPNPDALLLSSDSVVATKFDGTNILIFSGKDLLVTMNTHRSAQHFMNSSDIPIAKFEKEIRNIAFHEILPTTFIVTFEDGSSEAIDYTNPPPFKNSKEDKISRSIFNETHVTMLITAAFLLIIFAIVAIFCCSKQYIQTYQPVPPSLFSSNNSVSNPAIRRATSQTLEYQRHLSDTSGDECSLNV